MRCGVLLLVVRSGRALAASGDARLARGAAGALAPAAGSGPLLRFVSPVPSAHRSVAPRSVAFVMKEQRRPALSAAADMGAGHDRRACSCRAPADV
jgi:hypothetical protein